MKKKDLKDRINKALAKEIKDFKYEDQIDSSRINSIIRQDIFPEIKKIGNLYDYNELHYKIIYLTQKYYIFGMRTKAALEKAISEVNNPELDLKL